MTCTAVTSRASEGPCAALIDWAMATGVPCWGQPDDHCEDHGEGTCTIHHVHHDYLGPVVERCGHPESVHIGKFCIECEWPSDHSLDGPYDIEWEHAYTEEPVAQSQERRG